MKGTTANLEIWEIVRGMLDRFQERTGLGIEWIAGELSQRMGKEIQSRTIYRYQERNGLSIHHHTMVILTEITDDPAALHEFAHRLNSAVITLPQVKLPNFKSDVKEVLHALKETTEGIEASAEALEQGPVTTDAWRRSHIEIMGGVEELLVLDAVVKARWEKDNGAPIAE